MILDDMFKRIKERQRQKARIRQKLMNDRQLRKLKETRRVLTGLSFGGYGYGDIGECLDVDEIRDLISEEIERRIK